MRLRSLQTFMQVGFFLAAAVAAIAGCSGPSQSVSTPAAQVPIAKSRVHPLAVVPVPGGVYLGAAVHPTPGGNIEMQTENLEQQVYGNSTTHLALHLHYLDWVGMSTAGTNPDIIGDINHGRVPVISMQCGDDIPPAHSPTSPLNLIDITKGGADTDLATIKNQLLMLKYPAGSPSAGHPYPVMIRLFWEFNINAGQVGDIPNPNANGNGYCFLANSNVPLNQQFINAWQYIHNHLSGQLFQPNPQITWVWNPSVIPDSAYGQVTNIAPSATYYPGNDWVDWIAGDGYSVLNNSLEPETFDEVFGGFYTNYSQSTYAGKPLMIGETGSCNNYVPNYSPDQVTYISSLQSELKGPNSISYSQIHALMYFDSHVSDYNFGGTKCSWLFGQSQMGLDSESGIQAFSHLAQDNYFLPKVPLQ